jgi:hypothetical protein
LAATREARWPAPVPARFSEPWREVPRHLGLRTIAATSVETARSIRRDAQARQAGKADQHGAGAGSD